MPFTPAHAAIVLPFNYFARKYLSLTALMVGSMVPDFEYFIRLKPVSIYSHTLKGLFWFDLPLGLLLLILFDGVVRNLFIDNLPLFFRKRLASYKNINTTGTSIKQLAVIATSLLLGSASHLLWDSFTHITGYFVVNGPLLNTIDIAGHAIPLFKLLQHASTLMGLIVIAYAIMQLPPVEINNKNQNSAYWPPVFIIAFITVAIRLIAGLNITNYGSVIVSFISGFLLGLLLTGIYNKLLKTAIYR